MDAHEEAPAPRQLTKSLPCDAHDLFDTARCGARAAVRFDPAVHPGFAAQAVAYGPFFTGVRGVVLGDPREIVGMKELMSIGA